MKEGSELQGDFKSQSSAAPAALKSLRGILTGAALATLLAGCKPSAQQQQGAPPPPVVTVAAVKQQEVVEWDEFSGRVEALETVEVRPRVSGHMHEVRFKSGQMVKKGDVLFVIDPRMHRSEFERRDAEFNQAKARLENAERESKRTQQLLETKAVSTEEADTRQSRFTEAKAALQAAQAGRDTAELDLQFTEVRAAIDGRISRPLITPGNYVSGVAGFTTLLTTIVTSDPVYVYADVDEQSLLKFNALARGDKGNQLSTDGKTPVQLQLANEDGFPHQGWIESFDNRVDPNTGSILLRAIVPNPTGVIVPGLFARLRVPLSQRYPSVVVDEQSIGTDQGQKFVYTISETNSVLYRSVKLGPLADGKRIIRSGLKPGERIIVNGLQRVIPGMVVKPEIASATNEIPVASVQR